MARPRDRLDHCRAREIERHRVRQGRGHGRDRSGTDVTGRRVMDRRPKGGGPGQGRGDGERRVLPIPRRSGGGRRRRGGGGGPSGGGGRRRGRAGGGGGAWYGGGRYRPPPLSALIWRAPGFAPGAPE